MGSRKMGLGAHITEGNRRGIDSLTIDMSILNNNTILYTHIIYEICPFKRIG